MAWPPGEDGGRPAPQAGNRPSVGAGGLAALAEPVLSVRAGAHPRWCFTPVTPGKTAAPGQGAARRARARLAPSIPGSAGRGAGSFVGSGEGGLDPRSSLGGRPGAPPRPCPPGAARASGADARFPLSGAGARRRAGGAQAAGG